MALRFELGAASLDLYARTYPVEEPKERLQVVSRTAAGSLRVADKGIEAQTFRLALKNVTAAKRAELLAWHDSVAIGAMNAFTFIDEASVSRTVRWTNGWQIRWADHNAYEGEIVLELDA